MLHPSCNASAASLCYPLRVKKRLMVILLSGVALFACALAYLPKEREYTGPQMILTDAPVALGKRYWHLVDTNDVLHFGTNAIKLRPQWWIPK